MSTLKSPLSHYKTFSLRPNEASLSAPNLDPNKTIKNLIWLYFFLLLFEGALRKWVLPALSNPLLVVRDPVAIWIIIKAMNRKMLPANNYLTAMIVVGAVGLVTAIFFGHGNVTVAIYGARILLLHFPLIFVIGNVFTREDVIKMGKIMLWIALPMTLLIAVQFYSPQSAWVNRGVGGNEAGAGFSGALGYFRPPATFSFTNGNTLFYSLLAPFLLFFWLNTKHVSKLLLIAGTVCLLAAIPLSISRALFFQVAVCIAFTVIATVRKQEYIGKMLIAAFIVMIAFAFISNTQFYKTSTEAFTARFDGANKTEGGLVDGVIGNRYLGGIIRGFQNADKTPVFGYGIGLGTNLAVSIFGPSINIPFNVEEEYSRLIGETGLFLGIITIICRLALSLKVSFKAFKNLKTGDILPWLLVSILLTNVPWGQWAQPTALGFAIIIGGISIASFNQTTEKANI